MMYLQYVGGGIVPNRMAFRRLVEQRRSRAKWGYFVLWCARISKVVEVDKLTPLHGTYRGILGFTWYAEARHGVRGNGESEGRSCLAPRFFSLYDVIVKVWESANYCIYPPARCRRL